MEAPKEYKISAENMDKLSNLLMEIPTRYGMALVAFLQGAMFPVEEKEACKCELKEAKGDE